MKKNIVFLLIIIISLFLYKEKDYEVSKDAIRFRVIANSNSEEDIIMKEKVVNNLSGFLTKKGSKEAIEANIIKNLSNIEKEIDVLFANNNYKKTYNIVYGYNEFPEKEYLGKKYSKGYYKSLVIEIGDATGDNYWCFLYPSLCLIDIENDENIEYKFKVKEMLDNLFM